MTNQRFDPKSLVLLVVALIVTTAVLRRIGRRRAADHDVSDPGVTL
jgi:hypothetical protein